MFAGYENDRVEAGWKSRDGRKKLVAYYDRNAQGFNRGERRKYFANPRYQMKDEKATVGVAFKAKF